MTWSIATFNVMNLLEPTEAPHAGQEGSTLAPADSRIERLARVLADCGADVVAMQEIGSARLAAALLAAVPGAAYSEPVIGTPDRRGIRCAIASRLPLLGARVHTADALSLPAVIATDPTPFAAPIPLRRGVVHVVIDAPGAGPVHLIAPHFKSNRGAPRHDADGREVPATTARARAEEVLRSCVWRTAEALFVRELVDAALSDTAHPAEVVVAGDLNDVPGSAALVALRSEGAGAGELFDCAGIVPAERRFSVVHDGMPAQIDHVLATRGLFARLESARFVGRALGGLDSDHAALTVAFR
jgi:endonuclease/exonuclease/phosphatase family metal-dependent hydrolase